MASISGVSGGNNISSLYNSTNIISGLASGLDTEGMIEGLVQSYQNKITGLNQQVTKTQWEQEAYQSIIAKMVGFSNNYTSYTSGTNLMSASFFNSATTVSALGTYKDLVSASGKTDSEIALLAVDQLATAARYVTKSGLGIGGSDTTIAAEEGLDLFGKVDLGTLQGSLTLTYGSKTVSIIFDEVNDKVEGATAQEKAESLANLINEKLADEKITLNSGSSEAATDRIEVKAVNGKITFTEKGNAGNGVYISGASGTVADVLGLDLENAEEDRPTEISISGGTAFTKSVNAAEYLSGKTMNINLDGTTKSIKLPEIVGRSGGYWIKDADGKETPLTAQSYTDALSAAVSKAFGDRVQVSNTGSGNELKLSFTVDSGSSLLINSDVGEALGIGKTASNYLQTGKTLGELMDFDKLNLKAATDEDGNELKDAKGNTLYAFEVNGVTIGNYSKDSTLSELMSDINENDEAGVRVSYSKTTREFVFTSKETGSHGKIEFGEGLAQEMFGAADISGNKALSYLDSGTTLAGKEFSLTVDGQNVAFNFIGDTGSLKDILGRINGTQTMKNNGWTASLSDLDGSLVITDKEGRELDVTYNEGIAKDLFDAVAEDSGYTRGQDAKFTVSVNGTEVDMTRSSNSVDIDGMTLNFKKTFTTAETDENGNKVYNTADAVTFESSADADKIVEAVKTMLADYNVMMAEIKKAYSTLPATNSSGDYYEPLTDDDMASMSETAIKNYEEKAKQGLLFGDYNLSSLYERMQEIFNMTGEDGALLQKMGISSSFSMADGTTTITLDENKLREVLESDPDAVMELFTRSTDSGAATDGIMQKMKTQLDRYAGITGATKGILVQEAGTPLSALSLLSNAYQTKIDNLNEEIEEWQDKLSDKVDYYTSQFSRLEVLINQMNSQSSALAGLMGGY